MALSTKISLVFPSSVKKSSLNSSNSCCNLSFGSFTKRSVRVCASVENPTALTGVIFEPFEEVKKEILAVPMSPQVSMARQKYTDECEAAINEQIKSVRTLFIMLFKFLLIRSLCLCSIFVNLIIDFFFLQCGVQCFVCVSLFVCVL